MSREIAYHCILKSESGEKLTEYVSGDLPKVGQVLHLHALQVHGDYEVLEVTNVAQIGGYVVVSVKVKAVEHNR